jgi:hypothetical protein
MQVRKNVQNQTKAEKCGLLPMSSLYDATLQETELSQNF